MRANTAMTRLRSVAVLFLIIAMAAPTAYAAQARASQQGAPEPGDDRPAKTSAHGARPISVMDLLTVREVQDLAISPGGELVAYRVHQDVVEANVVRGTWFVAALDGSEPTKAIGDAGRMAPTVSGAMAKSSKPKWSADGKSILYLLRRNDETQLWRSFVDGRKQEQLTANPADVRDFWVSNDGGRVYFEVGAPRSAKRRALQKEFAKGVLFDESIIPAMGARVDLRLSGNLRTVRFYEPLESVSEIWTYDLRSGEARQAAAGELDELESLRQPLQVPGIDNFREAALSPGGDRIAFVQPGELGTWRIGVYDMASGNQRFICDSPACAGRVAGIWWSEDENSIYVMNDGGLGRGETVVNAVSPPSGEIREILRTDNFLSARSEFFEPCPAAAERLICVFETPTTPPRLVSIDLSDGQITEIANINPEFEDIKLTRTERMGWKNEFGDPTFGYLVWPADYKKGKRYPLIITTYASRGWFLRGGIGNEYPIRLFAANGFFVLDANKPRMDWRTSEGSRSLSGNHPGKAQNYHMVTSAFISAIEILDEKGLVDPARVGITGLSAGATAGAIAMSHTDAFGAAVFSTPNGHDPINYFTTGVGLGRDVLNLLMGIETSATYESAPIWRAISPALRARDIETPVLLNLADQEFVGALEFYIELTDAKKPVEMVIYPNEGHTKNQPVHRSVIYRRNTDWFNFWLRGVESGLLKDQEQYIRWSAMREEQCARLKAESAPWYCGQ